ncbi:hypothetical protein J6590_074115 [Homalodisca vitripennis]|nr:hypothetical protein J6590_074115 [Homalodisca vitripennis]
MMLRRIRPNICRRSANRTDDQQETVNGNSRIGMAHLRSTVNQKEVDIQRMQRVRAHRSQQRAREKEIDRLRKRNAPVNMERVAFSYDPEIDYSADTSVTIGKISIICQQLIGMTSLPECLSEN